MSVATYPEAPVAHPKPQIDKVIVIAGGSRDIEFPEDLREEIRRSGWDCEIVQGDISDCTHIRKLIHEVLDSVQQVDALVNHAAISSDRYISRMTDEEWLAQ
jgi:NAD(P)-dependent dehydrogenase (short-subunit alcohol dehydrogenase family)